MPLHFQHLLCVAAFAVLAAMLIVWSRRQPTTRRRVIEIAIGTAGVMIWIAVLVWWLQPERYSPAVSLPLQVCDLVGLIAPLAMLTRRHEFRTLLHFWGFGLCTQWVCTPVTTTGPESMAFWISFMLHASILGSACHDFFAGGYRSTWRDWRFAAICGVAYSALAHGVNMTTGGNYGYLGQPKPTMPTIVDALGPWPLRMLWIVLLGLIAITLVKLAGGALGTLIDTRNVQSRGATGRNHEK